MEAPIATVSNGTITISFDTWEQFDQAMSGMFSTPEAE
jgi:hypothetical protein